MADHDDLKHELRATKTVGGSIDTFLFSVRNRLQAAADSGDWLAVRALLADLDDRDGIRSAISHGTVAADQARDVDPDAPVPASNPGSLGGNVYGSQGPADTARQNAMGEPVGGVRDAAQEPKGDPKDAAPGLKKYSPGEGEDTRGHLNAAEQEQHDREHPDASRREPSAGDSRHTGEQTGQQHVNPTGEDQRTDRPSFGASDGERRAREPA